MTRARASQVIIALHTSPMLNPLELDSELNWFWGMRNYRQNLRPPSHLKPRSPKVQRYITYRLPCACRSMCH